MLRKWFNRKHREDEFSREKPLFLGLKESDRDVYWPLSRTAASIGEVLGTQPLAQLSSDDGLVDVISFSQADDFDLRANHGESTNALTKRLMAEDFVGVEVVSWRQQLRPAISQTEISLKNRLAHFASNVLKNFGTDASRARGLNNSDWLYAATVERMADVAQQVRVWPGRAVLRTMLHGAFGDSPMPAAPYVTGVVFTGDIHTIVILFKASDLGELEAMQSISVSNSNALDAQERSDLNTSALEQAVNNYIQHVRLASLDTVANFPQERICLFDGAEFARQLGRSLTPTLLRPYPAEKQWFGLGIDAWWTLGLRVSVVSLVAALCVSAYAVIGVELAKQNKTTFASSLESTQQALHSAILNKWSVITKDSSVPVDRSIVLAQSLFREGVRLEIDANRQQILIKLIAKVEDPSSTPFALTQLLNILPPSECSRRPPETNQQLSELYLTYECTSIDHRLYELLVANR